MKFKFIALKDFCIFLFLLSLALWSVWPIVKNPLERVTDTWDGVFIVWQVNSSIQKIPQDIRNIFDGNIFYPYKHVKAYSEPFIVSSVLSWLPVKLTGEPVAATSTMIILGQVLVMFILYRWLYEFSDNKFAALLGALAFSLSQIRFHYQVHLQMWMMIWVLLAMYFLWKFVRTGSIKNVYFSLIFAAIQSWESVLPVFFYGMFFVVIIFFNLKLFRKNLKPLIIAGMMFLTISLPVIGVFYSVSNEFKYVRPIREVAHFSASVDDYWGIFLSPGSYILTAVSFVMLFFQKKRDGKILIFLYSCILIPFLMSLGPVLKWGGKTVKLFGNIFIPLPYGILYYIIPGFEGLRTPSRWIWLFGLFLSFVVAYAFRNWKSRKNILLSVIFLMIAILGGTRLKNVYKVPRFNEYPQVYKWLKDQPGNVILEYPMYTWGAGDIAKTEGYRMMYSLYYKKHLVNGYSGFNPPEWEKLVGRVDNNFPDEKVVNELKDLGVDYVVVDTVKSEESVMRKIRDIYKGNIIWEDEAYLVLRI